MTSFRAGIGTQQQLDDRGRKERMDFADSFITAYHFRLLYLSSQCMYPIMGALRKFYGKDWEVSHPTNHDYSNFPEEEVLVTCVCHKLDQPPGCNDEDASEPWLEKYA